jgi:hypothetical protein
MKDFLLACLLGGILGAMVGYAVPSHAQSYAVTSPMGYNQGTVQINGNTAQFVNSAGVITQTATLYPNQVVITTPNGVITNVIGNTGYTTPPSPSTPSSPRVMQ